MKIATWYAELSREARDTLFLLVVIAWTVAPHAPHLPLWCIAMVVLAMVWRADVALRTRPLPGKWTMLVCLTAAVSLTWWSHHTIIGKEAGLTLVVVLTALKTLELRARRDAFVVFFLGFFLILTQFLYSQSLLTAASMSLAIWAWLTALTLAHLPVGKPRLRDAAKLSGMAALLGVPTMVVLFMFFPRIPPLWGTPDGAAAHLGLSSTMRVGDIAELALDDGIAMRFRVVADEPGRLGRLPSRWLYFRGPVLSHFDGQQWLASKTLTARLDGNPLAAEEPRLQLLGHHIVYEMTIEPSRLRSLPLLEASAVLTTSNSETLPAVAHSELQWRSAIPLTDRVRVVAHAWTAFQYGPTGWTTELSEDLELPEASNPRAVAWAMALRRATPYDRANAAELAEALMRHIRTQAFRYTLSPGTYGANSIDEFWLDRRAGFCEHYAAAFVFLMRAMGVPARVVTGYQGADYNPVDGFYVVRNSHAHAWAEYWMAGVGWIRADPTAAVDPQRIDAGLALTAPPGFLQSTLQLVQPQWSARLHEIWEAANNRWNQSVLNYSSSKQYRLLRELGVPDPNWGDLTRYLVLGLAAMSLSAAIWVWREGQERDPWLRAYQKIRRAFHRVGYPVANHVPPLRLAQLVSESTAIRPPDSLVAQVHAELTALDQLRYGSAPSGKKTNFAARVDVLRHQKRLIALAKALHYFNSGASRPRGARRA